MSSGPASPRRATSAKATSGLVPYTQDLLDDGGVVSEWLGLNTKSHLSTKQRHTRLIIEVNSPLNQCYECELFPGFYPSHMGDP